MYLAYDVGGTRIKSGLVSREGKVIRRLVVPTQGHLGAQHVLERLVELGRELVGDEVLEGIGVGFTGVIDTSTGTVLQLNGKIPDIEGVSVGGYLQEVFGVPTKVDNDARVYALGEWVYGAGKGYEDVVCVTIGTGVGTGVISGGKLLRSSGRLAGILGGHFTVEVDGELCSCGNVGCWEVYASATALVGMVRRHLERGCGSGLVGRQVDVEGVLGAVEGGDELACWVFERWVRYLASGVVTLVHAYDPQVVVLGGGVMGRGELVLPKVREYVARHAWTYPKGRVEVRGAELGDDAALLGAVALVMGGYDG